jgi:hypothetical protein
MIALFDACFDACFATCGCFSCQISPFGTGFHPLRSRIAPCKTFTPKKYGKARKDTKSGHPRMVSANARLFRFFAYCFSD